jgi:hypothetical protein
MTEEPFHLHPETEPWVLEQRPGPASKALRQSTTRGRKLVSGNLVWNSYFQEIRTANIHSIVVNTAGPEKESSQNRAGSFSKGKAPFRKFAENLPIFRSLAIETWKSPSPLTYGK